MGAVGLVESILPLHDHAQVLVVQDEALGVEALNAGRRQLLAVHQETAVTVDVNHRLHGKLARQILKRLKHLLGFQVTPYRAPKCSVLNLGTSR